MKGNANVQARNAETGWVPLHDAASRGHSEVVQVLLTLNTPAHPRTPKGETPLMLAQSYPDCAKILRKVYLLFFRYRITSVRWPLSSLEALSVLQLKINLLQHFYLLIAEDYRTVEPTLRRESWYHGTLDRREAVELLREHGNKEGSYLVRYSDKHGGMNVLTMMVGGQAYHFHIKTKVNPAKFTKITCFFFSVKNILS